MRFTGIQYLLFLALAVVLCRMAPARSRGLFILAFSAVFYAGSDPRGLLPLAGATLLAWLAARQLEVLNGNARQMLASGTVIALLLSLFLFKDMPAAVRPAGWILPLGISYYTFKLISYVLDVTWGKYKAERNLIAFASFPTFFPQIVAGPIQRADDYFQRLAAPLRLTQGVLLTGTCRIALGLFKKLVVADQMAVALSAIYADPHSASGVSLLTAFYLFPVQLYADFGGLSDIAIGSALLLGIASPENFDKPFAASSVAEYWRRWHMSLTSWTADYVFTPLRMSLRSWNRAGLVVSIWLNMMSIALWHGIAWTFAAFGIVHSVLVSADLLTLRQRKLFLKLHPEYERAAVWSGRVLTFHLVAFGMVFWRARTVNDALWMLGHLRLPHTVFLGMEGARQLVVGTAAFGALQVSRALWRLRFPEFDVDVMPRWWRWSFYSVSALALSTGLLLLFVHNSARDPFLYEIF